MLNSFKNRSLIFLYITVFFCLSQPLWGKLTSDEIRLQQRVKSLLGVDTLAPEQQYGFQYQLTVKALYNQLSPELQKTANTVIAMQVPEREYMVNSPSGHFRLHYDLDGIHAVPVADVSGNGIPDFVDSAAVFLDYAWQVEIEEIGFQPPLKADGSQATYMEIYFTNFPVAGLYGSTNFYEEIPSLTGYNYTSYIELHHTFQESALYTKGLDGMRVTCAHEFNHALQLGYRVWYNEDFSDIIDLFFFEMTSTWLEELLYRDINDYYQYLPGLFNNIQNTSITNNNYPYIYANGIFAIMLAERYGPKIIVDIWKQIRTEPAIDAINTVLKKWDTSFSEELNEYGRWMYFTGERSISGVFFEDAVDFPMVKIHPALFFNGSRNISTELNLTPRTFKYLEADSIVALRSLVKVDAGQSSGLRLNYFNDQLLDSKSSGADNATGVVLDFVPQDLVFVFSNTQSISRTINFTLNTDTMIVPDPDSLRTRVAFGPNPAVINDGISKYFYNVIPGSSVYIMDLNQRPVRKLSNDLNVDAILQWDMRDDNGYLVNSGIYIYTVVNGRHRQSGKIAVVR